MIHHSTHNSEVRCENKVDEVGDSRDKKQLTRDVIAEYANRYFERFRAKEEFARVPGLCPENINVKDVVAQYGWTYYNLTVESLVVTDKMVCSNFSFTPIYLHLLSEVKVTDDMLEFSYDVDRSVHFWKLPKLCRKELLNFLNDIIRYKQSGDPEIEDRIAYRKRLEDRY